RVHAARSAGARRRAVGRRLQSAADEGPRARRARSARAARGQARSPAIDGIRRILSAGSWAQPSGMGEESPRRIQSREDPRWADGRGAGLPDGEGEGSRASAVRGRAAVLVLTSALLSCGSKGSVALSASIQNASASVEAGSVLASVLKGGFDLYLEL